MKKLWMFLVGGVALMLLMACTASVNEGVDATNNGSEQFDTAAPRLNEDYEDALSVQGQLALGTVQLEESELAVDESQAADLLPLWQALQSLSNSDTTAEVELESVVNQIQNTMTAEQVQAISDMALTTDSLTVLAESGELQLGFGRGFGGADREEGESGFAGGGFRGGFAGGFPGGGPGGGFAVGGPGGGFQEGGFPGGGELSEYDIATRQAAFESGDFGGFQDRALMGMVIGLLANKSGVEMVAPRGNIFGAIFSAVSEATGVSTEEIQTRMADGETLAGIVEASGGDVTVVRQAILDALNALPNADSLEAEQIADEWLGESP